MSISTEERRIVTVLFADMAGSTALGEELDAEEMRRLLTRYYSLAREIVTQHGGTIEKFIGDAVMAVFGLPTAHGDDPDRAVAAALAAGQIDGVLHFSRRSVEAYLDCARTAALLDQALATAHYCLSAQIAEPLAAVGAMTLRIAARPDGTALLELFGAERLGG